MKKVLIVSIPMKGNVDLTKYVSDDRSLPVSEKERRFVITSFLEKIMKPEDHVKVLMLTQDDGKGFVERNKQYFMDEMNEANGEIGAKIEYSAIETEFDQDRNIYEQRLKRIVEEIEPGAHVLADITYGSKDLSIIIFAALGFAEKHLRCEIDNILYGQAIFENNRVESAKICDMVPLYALTSLTNSVTSESPERAKEMLNILLSV